MSRPISVNFCSRGTAGRRTKLQIVLEKSRNEVRNVKKTGASERPTNCVSSGLARDFLRVQEEILIDLR